MAAEARGVGGNRFRIHESVVKLWVTKRGTNDTRRLTGFYIYEVLLEEVIAQVAVEDGGEGEGAAIKRTVPLVIVHKLLHLVTVGE